MNIQDAYTQWAATYDQDYNLTRDLDRHITREVLTSLHDSTILEIGCGTGKNTTFLAQIGRRVLALDFSPGMIRQAKEKVPTHHVAFAVADVTKRWPCAERAVDLVVCNLVLEHVQDLSFIFAEAYRVLVPDGRFFICELHPFRQYQGKKARFQRAQETIEIPAFVHHLSEYVHTAVSQGFSLHKFNEWWHDEDPNGPPRLASFLLGKATVRTD